MKEVVQLTDKINCHEHCRYSRYCHRHGEAGLDPENCTNALVLEKIAWDAEQDRMEELREQQMDEEDDYE